MRDFGNERTNDEYKMFMAMSHEQLAVYLIRYKTHKGDLEVNV